MSDPFAELGIERRPLLDSDQLRTRYLQLAKTHHPDSRPDDADRFDSLKQSFEILLDPAKRLRSLAGGIEVQWLPHGELFQMVADAIEATRAATSSRTPPTSALALALRSQQVARARELVTLASTHLTDAIDQAYQQLASYDAQWPAVDNRELAQLASEFAFYKRWKSQLDEAAFGLDHIVL